MAPRTPDHPSLLTHEDLADLLLAGVPVAREEFFRRFWEPAMARIYRLNEDWIMREKDLLAAGTRSALSAALKSFFADRQAHKRKELVDYVKDASTKIGLVYRRQYEAERG